MFLRLALIASALVVAVAPMPSHLVERWYSSGAYLRLQGVGAAASNRVPVALFDIVVGVLLVVGLVGFIRRLRTSGVVWGLVRAGRTLVVSAAALYLIFVAIWGLNYRRVPLEARLDYDRARVSPAAALTFARRAVAMLNEGHAAAHATAPDRSRLEASFADAQRALGASRVAVVGAPKRSLINLYMPYAAIDGMTIPFFFEFVVNPEVLDVERPFVVAHEWAHLAGYAVESEANFVAWLTCVGGDPLAKYSGWFSAYEHVVGVLSREDRRTLALAPGPIADLGASAERFRRSSPVIRSAAREVNDKYLKANRVAEGIGSYDVVLRLLLGTEFDAEGRPMLRKGG